MFRKPISTSVAASLKHLRPRAVDNVHPAFLLPHHTFPRTHSQHAQHQPSSFAGTLRGFTTTRNQHAAYRRFGDGSHRPTWGLSISPIGSYSEWDTDPRYYIFPSLVAVLAAAGGVYYVNHLEKVELTGRWRFMDTSVEAENAVGEQVYQETMAQFHSKLLPEYHPTSRYVATVAQKIIRASALPQHPGQSTDDSSDSSSPAQFDGWESPGPPTVPDHGPSSGWKIHVINEPKIQNAFVIPGGKIFVFTGILPICQNEDGLASVLGHEVAHQVLRHPAERMSRMKIIFLVTTFLSFVGVDPHICRSAVNLLMTLPNSRRSETEADHIGLNIMAAACFDPREAIGVWERMEKQEWSLRVARKVTEFLQTHPTHGTRIEKVSIFWHASWPKEPDN